MALKCFLSAIGFTFRIKMQHYSCNFTPVSIFRVGVEHAQIDDDVFLLVNGQRGIRRRSIGNIWIKRRLLLGRSRNTWLITKFALALGILMTAARLQLGYKYAPAWSDPQGMAEVGRSD
jgi:hypothetical protein